MRSAACAPAASGKINQIHRNAGPKGPASGCQITIWGGLEDRRCGSSIVASAAGCVRRSFRLTPSGRFATFGGKCSVCCLIGVSLTVAVVVSLPSQISAFLGAGRGHPLYLLGPAGRFGPSALVARGLTLPFAPLGLALPSGAGCAGSLRPWAHTFVKVLAEKASAGGLFRQTDAGPIGPAFLLCRMALAALFQCDAQGVGEVHLIGANHAFRLFHIGIIGWGGFIPMGIVRQKRSQTDAPGQLARDRNEGKAKGEVLRAFLIPGQDIAEHALSVGSTRRTPCGGAFRRIHRKGNPPSGRLFVSGQSG